MAVAAYLNTGNAGPWVGSVSIATGPLGFGPQAPVTVPWNWTFRSGGSATVVPGRGLVGSGMLSGPFRADRPATGVRGETWPPGGVGTGWRAA